MIPEENAFDTAPANIRKYAPRPIEPRERSSRLKKPIHRPNLTAEEVSIQAYEIDNPHVWSMVSVIWGLKLFLEKTALAIESEMKALLIKDTFSGVDMSQLTQPKRNKILRSIMNITEKSLPTLNSEGNREIDKSIERSSIGARNCEPTTSQMRSNHRLLPWLQYLL